MQKKKLNISCIIPTHNRNIYLQKSINSIINQTIEPIEVIVVDDIGSEETRNLVNNINEITSITVRYIKNDIKSGAPISRNIGVENASGDLVALLDDDDLWEPEYLEKMHHKLKQSNKDFAISWIKMLKNNQLIYKNAIPENWNIKKFTGINPGVLGSNFLIYKQKYLEIGGFDTKLKKSQDLDFFFNAIIKKLTFTVVKEYLVIYRQHDGERISKNYQDDNKIFKSFIYFYKKHKKNIPLKAKIVTQLIIINCVKTNSFSSKTKIYYYLLFFLFMLPSFIILPFNVYNKFYTIHKIKRRIYAILSYSKSAPSG